MPYDKMAVDFDQLAERVRAACWRMPAGEMEFRRLATRSKDAYDPKNGFMIPLKRGTHDCYAVELVPCDADAPGAVSMRKDHDPYQIRIDAETLYDLWVENLPDGVMIQG